MKENNRAARAARAARFLVQCLDVSGKRRCGIFIFEVLTTTQARSSKSHSLPLHENHSYQASESALLVFCTT